MEKLYSVKVEVLKTELWKKGEKLEHRLNSEGVKRCKEDKTVKIISIERWC